VEPPAVAYPKCRENAEKAKSLDPNLAGPWATLDSLETVANNWSKADELLIHAKSLNKNYASALQWHGGTQLRIGSLDEAY